MFVPPPYSREKAKKNQSASLNIEKKASHATCENARNKLKSLVVLLCALVRLL